KRFEDAVGQNNVEPCTRHVRGNRADALCELQGQTEFRTHLHLTIEIKAFAGWEPVVVKSPDMDIGKSAAGCKYFVQLFFTKEIKAIAVIGIDTLVILKKKRVDHLFFRQFDLHGLVKSVHAGFERVVSRKSNCLGK